MIKAQHKLVRRLYLIVLSASACAAPMAPGPEATEEKGVPSREEGTALVGINGVGAGWYCNSFSANVTCLGSYSVRRSIERSGGDHYHLLPDSTDVSEMGEDERKAYYDRQARSLLESVDCLVMRGGADIDPEEYDQTPDETVDTVDQERWEFDAALIREAMRIRMPVLGICLGMQELNVVQNGSLVQDIPSDGRYSGVDHRSNHTIDVVPGTLMSEVYSEAIESSTPITVKSIHHQAVDQVGTGLMVSARSADGVVEAIESSDRSTRPFVVGVQYHPERHRDGRHDGLMNRFNQACLDYRASR